MLELFEVRMPVAELILRGSAIFWFLFLIFRFVMRRDVGAVGIADVLLVVLVADASQNAMAGSYTTITEGFILVATIVGWNWVLDWLAYHSALVRKFVEPRRLLLIADGKPQQHNMKKHYITLDDLESKLREQGVESLREVKRAFLEGDGEVSVIRYRRDDAGSSSGGGKSKSPAK